MRIMAVCLLRIGDILMCAPALRALKQQHPDAELHVLINAEFKFCTQFMPFVDRFHFFLRREFQENLGDPQDPILNSFDVLKNFLQSINQLKFDVVYNFTHNRLSGYLCGAIEAPEKLGMHGSEPDNLSIDGSWFRYLNRPQQEVKLHFCEIFQRAVGNLGVQNIFLAEDPAAAKWADQALEEFRNCQRLIGLQCFSNEKRKQVPTSWWTEMLSHEGFNGTMVLVLAAPWEESEAHKIVDDLRASGVLSRVFVCSFSQAFSLIKRLDGLITVDTSIKHLGSATETPIVEFAIGGSLPQQTGVFSEHALIFEIQHWDDFNSPASLKKVADAMNLFLENEKTPLPLDINGIRSYRPLFVNHATWFLKELSTTGESHVGQDLLRQAFSIGEVQTLEENDDVSLASSLAFSIADEMNGNLQSLRESLSDDYLSKMQKFAHIALASIERAHNGLNKVFSGQIHFLDWFEDYKSTSCASPSEGLNSNLSQFSFNDPVVNISEIRRMQEKLNRTHRQENWNLKFLRTLHNHMMEKT